MYFLNVNLVEIEPMILKYRIQFDEIESFRVKIDIVYIMLLSVKFDFFFF